jgi:predicted transcriptional regulator
MSARKPKPANKRARRAGATQTIGVSLDPDTKRKLKELARARHHGNVSALIAEMTEEAVRQAAFEHAWALYGGPEPSDERRAAIDAELEEGWRLARDERARAAKQKRKSPSAA